MNRYVVPLVGLALTFLVSRLYAAEPVMLDKTQTYCFGRYLVDIPLAAELKGQGNTYLGAKINAERMGPEALRQRIEKRITVLKEGKSAAEYFGFKQQIKINEQASLLLGYQVAYGDPMYSIDSFKWDRGWAFISSQSLYDDKKIDSLIERFRIYLRNVRYRSPREIPTEPGFCIENGFIANDGKTAQVEDASLAFQLKNNPDVWITVSSDVYFKQEKPLLQRIKESGVDKKFPGKGHVVSAQDRVINGMHGQESLDDFPSDDETGVAQSFVWETLGEVATPLKPSIQLNISSGNGIAGQTSPSSLSTKQIQALYESIVKTIRIRPTH